MQVLVPMETTTKFGRFCVLELFFPNPLIRRSAESEESIFRCRLAWRAFRRAGAENQKERLWGGKSSVITEVPILESFLWNQMFEVTKFLKYDHVISYTKEIHRFPGWVHLWVCKLLFLRGSLSGFFHHQTSPTFNRRKSDQTLPFGTKESLKTGSS